jgi:hypothetical protein
LGARGDLLTFLSDPHEISGPSLQEYTAMLLRRRRHSCQISTSSALPLNPTHDSVQQSEGRKEPEELTGGECSRGRTSTTAEAGCQRWGPWRIMDLQNTHKEMGSRVIHGSFDDESCFGCAGSSKLVQQKMLNMRCQRSKSTHRWAVAGAERHSSCGR